MTYENSIHAYSEEVYALELDEIEQVSGGAFWVPIALAGVGIAMAGGVVYAIYSSQVKLK